MKQLTLILLAVQFVFSLGYETVTINSDHMGTTETHFPYSINLSRLDSAWWDNCDSASWIYLTDTNNTRIPSQVDTDFSKDLKRGVITFDASISSTANRKYRVWTDSGAGSSDSFDVYWPSWCYSRLGFDAPSGNFVDYSGGFDNVASNITYQQAGIIGTSAQFNQPSSSSLYQSCVIPISGTQRLTVTGIMQYTGSASQSATVFMHRYTSYRQVHIQNAGGTYYFYITNDPTNTAISYGSWATTGITAGQFFHYALVIDLTAATKADQVKWYINGVQRTISFATPNFPAILPEHKHIYSVNIPNISIGYNPESSGYYLNGYYDELRQYNQAKSSGWVTTEYNMAFDTGSVSVGAFEDVDEDSSYVYYMQPCTVLVSSDYGYAWRVNGGEWSRDTVDTVIFIVHQDTMLTAESFFIPTDARTVVISPASLTIDTGSTRQFSATYYDTIGRIADPQPATTWAATFGSIDGDGLYSAGADTGSGIVRGYNGAIADTASVAVRFRSSAVSTLSRWSGFFRSFRDKWRR